MKQGLSLERKIRNALILLVLPAFLIVTLVSGSLVQKLANQYVIGRLQLDAENVITALDQNGKGWQIDSQRVSSVYQRVRSGRYYTVLWAEGEIRSRSLWDWKPDVSRTAPGQSNSHREVEYGDQVWLTWQQGIHLSGSDLTIWVAEDITEFEQQQRLYSYYMAGFLLLLMLLILFLQRQVLRQGFAALEPLQESLKSGQISGAVSMPDEIPQEVKPLADAIQKLVRHSGEQLSRSRMATGNLAHELKLPMQQLQMIAADKEHPESTQIEEVYRQLRRRVDKELRRAKISGSPAPGELFDAESELPWLEKLLNQGAGKELETDFDLPDELMPFDRDDMLELIGNLLDNAWRYAQRKIELKIWREDQCWLIRVADDGVGIREPERERMMARGIRSDESDDRNYGLGLSICQSVVASYKGDITLGQACLGGLEVLIRLPQSEGGCSIGGI